MIVLMKMLNSNTVYVPHFQVHKFLYTYHCVRSLNLKVKQTVSGSCFALAKLGSVWVKLS